jgi:hypothetical protein
VRAGWQALGAPTWVRPRPDPRPTVTAAELVSGMGSPEVGALGAGAERPACRRTRPLSHRPALVGLVVAVAELSWPGPRVGRAPRVEDRRGSVPGPKGPGTGASAPAPTGSTVAGVR